MFASTRQPFKNIIHYLVITGLLFGQVSAMQQVPAEPREDQKEQVQVHSKIPLPLSLFKRRIVPLLFASGNELSLVFDQPQGMFLFDYQADGKPVGHLIQTDGQMFFESHAPQKYDFLLKSSLKTGRLHVDTKGRFVFEKPVEIEMASFACKSVEFLDIFSSTKNISLAVDYCDNCSDVTCTDLLFQGNQFNCMPESKLTVQGSLAVLATKGLFNDGQISSADNVLIQTPSFENWGTVEAEKLIFEGGDILNEGLITIHDSFAGLCKEIDHRGRLKVDKDCILEKVDNLITTRSSSWHVGNNWKSHIAKLHLAGSVFVGNLALFNVASHAILGGHFHAPIIHVESNDLITCDFPAHLIASHYIGLKAKGWIDYQGDVVKKFVHEATKSKTLNKESQLFKIFPRGVFLHSQQSGIKKSGSIVSKQGTVSLDAKKGLIHTGVTDAGIAQDAMLLMNAASLNLEKDSLLKSLNAKLNAQNSVKQQGDAQIKNKLTMQAPQIVHSGSSQAAELVVQADTIETSISSRISAGKIAVLAAKEKIKNAGAITSSNELGMFAKDITLQGTSRVTSGTATLKADETIDNHGNLNASANLLLHAKYVENANTISAHNAHIKADRWWWNTWNGSVDVAEQLIIDAGLSMNTGGWLRAHDLNINAGVDLNLFGRYYAKNTTINSLIGLNAGLVVPQFDSPADLLTWSNALSVGEGLLTAFSPQARLALGIGRGLYGICTNGMQVYDQAQKLYYTENTDVSDWIPLLCSTKNLATSAYQTGKMGWDAGGKDLCEKYWPGKTDTSLAQQAAQQSVLPDASAQAQTNQPQVSLQDAASQKWKNIKESVQDRKFLQQVGLQTASSIASTLGPQVNRDSLIDINAGVTLGMNGYSRSIWNINGGVSAFANRYTVDTVYGSNMGIFAASDLNVHALRSYDSTGVLAAGKASVEAQNLTVDGKVGTIGSAYFKAENTASIGADVSASEVNIQAKEAVLKEGSHITARDGAAQVVADRITSKAAIDGKHVYVAGKDVTLQNGSEIRSHGGDDAVIIKADNQLKLESGSTMSGSTVAIDAKSLQGEVGNTISATNHTYVKTQESDNKGSIKGSLAVEFTGDVHQLKGIGHVDHVQYRGTVVNNLADMLVEGNSDLLHVSKSGSVTVLADKQDVHLKDQHDTSHACTVISNENITIDKTLKSHGSVGLYADKNINHKNIHASDSVDMSAGGNIVAESSVERTVEGVNYTDTIKKVHVTAGKAVNIDAQGGILHVGVHLHSGKEGTRMKAGGKIVLGAKGTEKYSETNTTSKNRKTTTTTKDTSVKAHVSEYSSAGDIRMQAGDTCELYGTTISTKGVKSIHGKNGTNGHEVYDSHEHRSESTTDGGWFGTAKKHKESSLSKTAKVVDFKGGSVPEVSSDAKISMAFTSDSEKVIFNAPELEFKLAQSEKQFVSESSTENLVWWSKDAQEKYDVTYSPTFKGTVETNAQKISMQSVEERAPWSVKTTHDHAAFNNTMLKEIHEHQKFSAQGPTKAASAVIALAITMATAGTGSAIGATCATAVGCQSAMASAIVTNMTSAVFTSLCVQSTSALLHCNGDFVAAGRQIASGQTIRNLAVAAITGGLRTGLEATVFNGLPSVSQATNINELAAFTMPREAMTATVNTMGGIASGQRVEDAVLTNVKSFAANTIGKAGAHQIGDAYGKGKIDPVTHKVLHAGLGAVTGGIVGGKEGAMAGAMGAVIAETIADTFRPKESYHTKICEEKIRAREAELGRALTKQEFVAIWDKQNVAYWQSANTVADVSKLTVAMVALVARQDVGIASDTATMAVDNNFLHLIGLGIIAGSTAYSAYNVYDAYCEGGPEAALKQLGIELITEGVGITTGAVVGKVGYKLGTKIYPTAKAVLHVIFDANPALKIVFGNAKNAFIAGAEKFGKSAMGNGLKTADKWAFKQTTKATRGVTNRLGGLGEGLAAAHTPGSVVAKMEAKAAQVATYTGQATGLMPTTQMAGQAVKTGSGYLKVHKPGEREASGVFNSSTKGKHSKLISSPKVTTPEDLIKSAKPGKKTGGVTTQYKFKGGFKEALDHFDLLKPKNVKIRNLERGILKSGILEDGRTIVVREFSGVKNGPSGPPTLEIQVKDSLQKIKCRYDQ
ncbi:MAG TPA: hypothetical protein PLU71_01475 [Candidatus Dependentiae bacterium]|nr:hypothetical protein [Candidatus Dependentiae bacterium]HRQ62502.1 hypothetical protein [Candidatus Dependentiae bacterium]